MSIEIWLGIVIVSLAVLGGIMFVITPPSLLMKVVVIGIFVVLGFIAICLVIASSNAAKRYNKELQDQSARDKKDLQDRLDRIELKIGSFNQKVEAKPVALQNQKRRGLRLSVEGANISVPPDPPNSTSLALMATIHNDSEVATVANDFNLEVITPDGKKHPAVFMRLGKEKELRWTSKSGVTTVIPGSDALEEKTYNHEIVRGGSVMGQAWFLLLGVPHDSIIDPTTKLIFSAKDNTGHVYEDTESIAEISRK